MVLNRKLHNHLCKKLESNAFGMNFRKLPCKTHQRKLIFIKLLLSYSEAIVPLSSTMNFPDAVLVFTIFEYTFKVYCRLVFQKQFRLVESGFTSSVHFFSAFFF